jgi:AraC-like DNA-binding protein
MEVHSERRADFWGEVRINDLGALRLASFTSAPHEVRRTPRLIRHSDPELYKLSVVLRGQVVIAQHEREAALTPRDLVIYDTSRPFRGVGGRPDEATVHLFTVLFPHSLLPFSVDDVGRLTAVRMPGRQGIGGLVSRFLLQLASQADEYNAPDAVRLSNAALDVLVALLAHQLDRLSAVPPETHRRALLLRIQAFIDQHLGDPGLSPSVIAAAHHVSVRYLYKLFQDHDMTVAGWIRGRRLDRCRRDLADPALWARPVSAIAARWGFADGAHFSRVFRAAYGIPPREYRRRAAQPHGAVRGS